MINLIRAISNQHQQKAFEQAYLQHFKVALANLEMNIQEDKYYRKSPSVVKKK